MNARIVTRARVAVRCTTHAIRCTAFVLACSTLALGCARSGPVASPRAPTQVIATARAMVESGRALSPRSPDQDLSEADERDLSIAVLLSERGQHADAVELLSALRRRNPDHAGVLEDLIWACIPVPDCHDGLPPLRRELQAHVDQFPRDLARRLTLLDLLEVTRAGRERRERIFALIRDYPTNAEGWVLAAELALADSELEAAAALLSRAAELPHYAEDNRERLDEARDDLALAIREREHDVEQAERESRRQLGRVQRSLSRRAFHLRLDDGDDF